MFATRLYIHQYTCDKVHQVLHIGEFIGDVMLYHKIESVYELSRHQFYAYASIVKTSYAYLYSHFICICVLARDDH